MDAVVKKPLSHLWTKQPGKKYIYIAGPMRGIKDFNFPAFESAAHAWKRAGWEVFSPHEMDLERHPPEAFKSEAGDLNDLAKHGFSLREALALDLEWIAKIADAIYLLRGWEASSGARAEHATAFAVGAEFFYQAFSPAFSPQIAPFVRV